MLFLYSSLMISYNNLDQNYCISLPLECDDREEAKNMVANTKAKQKVQTNCCQPETQISREERKSDPCFQLLFLNLIQNLFFRPWSQEPFLSKSKPKSCSQSVHCSASIIHIELDLNSFLIPGIFFGEKGQHVRNSIN